MLTNRQFENIQNFNDLSENYKKVLRYRLKKASMMSLKSLKVLLLKHRYIGMNIDDVIDVRELKDVVELYSKLKCTESVHF